MLELTLRVVLSLAVVLGLFWAVARIGSRKMTAVTRVGDQGARSPALSRGASIAVVEVGCRVLVVGISDGGVRLLTELDPVELESVQEVPEPGISPKGSSASGRSAYESGRAPERTALAGSLLAAQTWRQAWATATGRSVTGQAAEGSLADGGTDA